MNAIIPERAGIPAPDINVMYMLKTADKFFQHYRMLNDRGRECLIHYIEMGITLMGLKEHQKRNGLYLYTIEH